MSSFTLDEESNFGEKKPSGINLDNQTEAQLITLRTDIDNKLNLDISTLDMSQELSLQYKEAKALYAQIKTDDETPANQKAQILNTISNIISAITKNLQEIHTIERFKKIESATLAAAKIMPLDAKKAFFDMLKDHLELIPEAE